MASNSEDTAGKQTNENIPPGKQQLEDMEDRLVTLADKVTLCHRILSDLRGLQNVILVKNLTELPESTHK